MSSMLKRAATQERHLTPGKDAMLISSELNTVRSITAEDYARERRATAAVPTRIGSLYEDVGMVIKSLSKRKLYYQLD